MTSKLESVPLSDAFWFQEGPGVRKWQFHSSGIKLLNVGNITPDGNIDLSKTDRHLSEEEAFGKYSHFLVDAGDLVIASSGISFEDDGLLRTKVAFVREEHLPLCMNTSTIRFKPTTPDSSLSYLKHWLQSHEFRDQISRRVTGIAQLNFGPSHLKSMSISMPRPSEQRRIAAILDKADAIRRKREQALALADDFLKSVFLEMFGDPSENPRGWKIGTISDCLKSTVGGWSAIGEARSAKPNELGVLKISAVTSGEYLPTENKTVSTVPDGKKLVVPQVGDLLFSRANTRELVAATCIVTDAPKNVFLPDKLWKLETNSDVTTTPYLKFVLSDPGYRQTLCARASGTSGSMLNISKAKLLGHPIPIAPIKSQKAFEKIWWQNRETIKRLSDAQRLASDLFASLSQRAFNGDL